MVAWSIVTSHLATVATFYTHSFGKICSDIISQKHDWVSGRLKIKIRFKRGPQKWWTLHGKWRLFDINTIMIRTFHNSSWNAAGLSVERFVYMQTDSCCLHSKGIVFTSDAFHLEVPWLRYQVTWSLMGGTFRVMLTKTSVMLTLFLRELTHNLPAITVIPKKKRNSML